MYKASILPWCNVLYAVVDSRWPQKPGLCIDAAGAPPDGMVATVATVGTSAMMGSLIAPGTSGRWHKQQCGQYS